MVDFLGSFWTPSVYYDMDGVGNGGDGCNRYGIFLGIGQEVDLELGDNITFRAVTQTYGIWHKILPEIP